VLRRVAAVAVALAELLQLVVQVPHSCFARYSSVALVLVCRACPVSVSVRLACVSITRSTRDSGHHSRFVQSRLVPATAAPVLGVEGAFLLEADPSS
jgi:hypothetical protein